MAIPLLLATLVAMGVEERSSELREAFERAVAGQRERRWEEAARGYRRVLETEPDAVAARVYLAQVLLFTGRTEEARVELALAREAAPEPLLPLLLALKLDAAGASAELERRVPHPGLRRSLLDNVLLEGESYVSLGRPTIVLASLGDIEGALADYRASARIDPWNVEMHRLMGNALFKSSRNLEAVEAFRAVVALDPDDAAAHGQLGSSALRLMWWDTAIEALERARSLAGDSPGGLLALGYAYERKPDFAKALSLYASVAELAPNFPQAHYRMGRTLIKLDRLDEAERALSRALELDSGMVEAACFLGAVLLEKRDLEGAVAQLERATSLQPSFAKAHFYLSQAYLRSGRRDEAKVAMEAYRKLAASGEVEPP